MDKKELWLRIKNYNFNHIVTPNIWEKLHESFSGKDACTRAFADKISRKHSWTKNFSFKAITEYKKFVYLGVISDFNVTPSRIIDIVWHEHILFTNAYNEFCDDIIEYRLEHFPELIPLESDIEKFNEQYLWTIQLYFKEFGKPPLADVWQVTKFDKNQVTGDFDNRSKQSKKPELYHNNNNYSNDTALFESFTSSEISEGAMHEFGGGDFGGGGATGNWSDVDSVSSSSDVGGDGGSSCSSGCGGGD